MFIQVCTAVKENCWNTWDSYGEICVHCGCCSEDPFERAKYRLETLKERLEEEEHFNEWSDDPYWKTIQENNLRVNKKRIKKRIRYYENRIKELNKGDPNGY